MSFFHILQKRQKKIGSIQTNIGDKTSKNLVIDKYGRNTIERQLKEKSDLMCKRGRLFGEENDEFNFKSVPGAQYAEYGIQNFSYFG